jgi:hypothetical protein
MARKWTVEERKAHMRNFYPEKRRKWGIVIGCVVLVLLICAALGWAVRTQYDIGLVIILGAALVAAVLGSVFIIDNQFYETW